MLYNQLEISKIFNAKDHFRKTSEATAFPTVEDKIKTESHETYFEPHEARFETLDLEVKALARCGRILCCIKK